MSHLHNPPSTQSQTEISASELFQDVDQFRQDCRAAQHAKVPDSLPCYHLFERALRFQDQYAWQAIVAEFSHMLKGWIYNYSRFRETGEDVETFVNEAFTRLWRSGSKPAQAGEFGKLSDYLVYLKRCVWASIEDFLRRAKKDSLWHGVALSSRVEMSYPEPDIEAERAVLSQQLDQLLQMITEGEPLERLVAEESWVYGLTPRAIQAKYPELFSSVPQVSQSKRNILRRLQRHPQLEQLAEFLNS